LHGVIPNSPKFDFSAFLILLALGATAAWIAFWGWLLLKLFGVIG